MQGDAQVGRENHGVHQLAPAQVGEVRQVIVGLGRRLEAQVPADVVPAPGDRPAQAVVPKHGVADAQLEGVSSGDQGLDGEAAVDAEGALRIAGVSAGEPELGVGPTGLRIG